MKVLKSVAVGVATSLASIIVMVAASTLRWLWLLRNYQSPEEGDIGIDLVSTFSNIPYHWLIVLLCFCIGFVWTFRRLH